MVNDGWLDRSELYLEILRLGLWVPTKESTKVFVLVNFSKSDFTGNF